MFLKKRLVDLNLRLSCMRLGGGAGRFVASILCGMKAVDFVKYVQLVSRTMITLNGKRCSNGLTDTVKDQFVLGT